MKHGADTGRELGNVLETLLPGTSGRGRLGVSGGGKGWQESGNKLLGVRYSPVGLGVGTRHVHVT